MARSHRIDRAKAENKALRERAKAAAVPVSQLLQARDKNSHLPVHRRNGGRMDGVNWNGAAFICPQRVDDGGDGDCDDDDDSDPHQALAAAVPGKMVISLMDIAKPAKEKRKPWQDFEMVRLKQVLVVDDDDAGGGGDEEWELVGC